MTTNNHPAHGHVSLDRLHQISEILSKAAAQSDGGNLGYAMADAVKVIDGAIAAFGAEPVLYAMQGVNLDTDAISTSKSVVDSWVDEWNQERKLGVPEYKTVPLYTAPPAPVVPEQATVETTYPDVQTSWQDAKMYAMGWNACRAAMLQDAEPVTTASKLPFEKWLSQQTGTIDVECGCVMTEVFFHWLRVAYEAGNSPVTPDGWQLVPKEPTAAMNKAGWDAMNEHDAINPTYRAMLAAAPKQEVNGE
ncbi:hypothetical protein VC862_24770 [Citrobacter braakii]|uniref:hypothetical protein n=1 Tax=Citrobacter braakii TaxID=57706 RepID=UPI002B248083|nr:hypothetical protein [Citrobacter braakii]MEB1007797.1 hypothetical protein [Citrobacter braakii]